MAIIILIIAGMLIEKEQIDNLGIMQLSGNTYPFMMVLNQNSANIFLGKCRELLGIFHNSCCGGDKQDSDGRADLAVRTGACRL